MSDPAQPTPPAPSFAAPAAPPFGTPGGPAPQVYAPPPGYTGPYGAAATPAAARPAASGSRLGLVAFIAALVAAVGASLTVAVAAFNIGLGAAREIALDPLQLDFDWSVLTPVREWVLVAEMSFWAGTAFGVWGLVQGLIAIATNRGRRFGIAAVAVAIIGPVLFVLLLQGMLTAGLAAGSGIGG